MCLRTCFFFFFYVSYVKIHSYYRENWWTNNNQSKRHAQLFFFFLATVNNLAKNHWPFFSRKGKLCVWETMVCHLLHPVYTVVVVCSHSLQVRKNRFLHYKTTAQLSATWSPLLLTHKPVCMQRLVVMYKYTSHNSIHIDNNVMTKRGQTQERAHGIHSNDTYTHTPVYHYYD